MHGGITDTMHVLKGHGIIVLDLCERRDLRFKIQLGFISHVAVRTVFSFLAQLLRHHSLVGPCDAVQYA